MNIMATNTHCLLLEKKERVDRSESVGSGCDRRLTSRRERNIRGSFASSENRHEYAYIENYIIACMGKDNMQTDINRKTHTYLHKNRHTFTYHQCIIVSMTLDERRREGGFEEFAVL